MSFVFKNKNIKLPLGFICKDINEANQIGQWFLNTQRSCVLKSNFGESGWGLKILKNDQAGHVKRKIGVDKDSIWNDTSIIVEEYIQPDVKASGGSPSIEVYVGEDGPKITYICGQTVDNLGSFGGVSLGKDILDKKTTIKLRRLGIIVGREYWKMGYMGYFDIDAVVAKDTKEIYLIETNTRRTGGTHVYDIAKKLFGTRWEQKNFLISNDRFCYGKKIMAPNVIFDKIEDLLYPIDGSRSGIIATFIDERRPVIGFVIVGKDNKTECLKIYEKLIKLFKIKQ